MKGKIGLVPGLLLDNMTRTLNSFMITNCSLRISRHTIYLDIGLERLTDPYWMSLFIPTVSLILAAEITLFIDESQFKATIGVALTTSLVMQTIYNGIQEKLPENSSFKLIDAWLLHGTLMPMVVFVILAYNEVAKTLKSENSSSKMKSPKVANSSVTVKYAADQEKDNESKGSKTRTLACRILIPLASTIFIITFFLVIYFKQ